MMKYVAEQNDFQIGEDVRYVSSGHPKKFKEYIDNNWNKTTYGVVFCLDNVNSKDEPASNVHISGDQEEVLADVMDMTTDFQIPC